ncbi:sugar transferase [Pedobacter sp. Leaf170]|uniref:sugar transferase n=1 Tax=Pedobacter sp. Leaf170 TaxID=2876558 RepID=UPI001E31B1BE|nr:sugar transferase [Pedobacter sp. Leaf170]
MVISTINPSQINTKVVYFGHLLKSLIKDELNQYLNNIIYVENFKHYFDNEPLLSLPDVIIIEADENDDCFDQIDYIRNHPFLRGLIIILLGIRDDKAMRKAAMELHVDDYYYYPFQTAHLIERINFLVKFKLIRPTLVDLTDRFDQRYKIPIQKRIFDVVVSGLSLFVLSPLFLLIGLIIKLESKGTVLYKSQRVGAGYKIFDFYKFRSMCNDADKLIDTISDLNQYQTTPGCKQFKSTFVKFKNDPRITKFGSFLRKTSIDELPQLFNILIGDMSLVGNRPLPLYEAENLTTNEWSTRFLGPAGLTGLWQISRRGKEEMSELERKELDNFYSKNYSIFLDIEIIVKTFTALIQKEEV